MAISVIAEMEVLSSPKPRAIDLGLISDWLGQVTVHPISPVIRDQTIALRRERLLKLPDAIIAATAIALGVPLVNGDKRFLKAADRLDVRLLKLSR